MTRCIRLWNGDDDNSHFEKGVIDLSKDERGDILSGKIDVLASRSARREPAALSNGTTRQLASSSLL